METRFYNGTLKHAITWSVTGLCLFILCCLAPDSCLCASTKVSVFINKESKVRGHEILLGDIARIKGKDRLVIERIKKVYIGRSPLPAKSRSLDTRQILSRIKQAGIRPNSLNLVFPPTIRVEREFIKIPGKEIKKIVLNYILDTVPWGAESTKVKGIKTEKNVVLPRGKVTCRVVPPKNRDMLGKVPFQVQYLVDGQLARSVWATADIRVMTKVFVARRPVRRSHVITREDVALKGIEATSIPANIVTSWREIVGKRAKRKIAPGVIFTKDLVEQPPLFKRGDLVHIVAESGCLRVTAIGKAMNRGYEGKMVCVENLDSGKRIFAKVIDSNTVRVSF